MLTEGRIYCSYQKDMTLFDTLLKTQQKIVFDLSNVYSKLYTGAYTMTLEALYYNDRYISNLSPADHIFPISTLASAQNISSVMSLPGDNGSVPIQFLRNVKAATVSMLASGKMYPTEYVDTFSDNPR
jgi:hypothetical protein